MTNIPSNGQSELVTKIRNLRFSGQGDFSETILNIGGLGGPSTGNKSLGKESVINSRSAPLTPEGKSRSYTEVKSDQAVGERITGRSDSVEKERALSKNPDQTRALVGEKVSESASNIEGRRNGRASGSLEVKGNRGVSKIPANLGTTGNDSAKTISNSSLAATVVESAAVKENARVPLFKSKLLLNMESKEGTSSSKEIGGGKASSKTMGNVVHGNDRGGVVAKGAPGVQEKEYNSSAMLTGKSSITQGSKSALAVKGPSNGFGVQGAGNQVAGLAGSDKSIFTPGTKSSNYSSIAQRVNQVQDILSKTGGSIMKLVKGGGGKMSLRLDPPSLGKMMVEVEILKGVCNARVLAEDPAVKAALTKGLPQLRDALENSGLRLEGFTVDSRWHNGEKGRGGANEWGSNKEPGYQSNERNIVSGTKESDLEKIVNARPILGAIDIHI